MKNMQRFYKYNAVKKDWQRKHTLPTIANLRLIPKLIKNTMVFYLSGVNSARISKSEKGQKCLGNNLICILMEFMRNGMPENCVSTKLCASKSLLEHLRNMAHCFIRLFGGGVVGKVATSMQMVLGPVNLYLTQMKSSSQFHVIQHLEE